MLSTLNAVRCDKSLTENCCRILFMTCWHKFKWFSKVKNCIQCRQIWAFAAQRFNLSTSRTNKATSASDRSPSTAWVLSSAKKLIWYLHGSYFLPNYSTDVFLFCFLSAISIFLSLGSANVRHLHWTLSLLHIISRHATYCWLSIILFLYSVFQSVSEKLHTPPL